MAKNYIKNMTSFHEIFSAVTKFFQRNLYHKKGSSYFVDFVRLECQNARLTGEIILDILRSYEGKIKISNNFWKTPTHDIICEIYNYQKNMEVFRFFGEIVIQIKFLYNLDSEEDKENITKIMEFMIRFHTESKPNTRLPNLVNIN